MATVLDEAGLNLISQRGNRFFDEADSNTEVVDQLKELYTRFQLADSTVRTQNAALTTELTYRLLTAGVSSPTLAGFQVGTVVSEAQTGTGNSEVFDFQNSGIAGENVREPTLVRIVTTVGSTPTCTYQIQGSVDKSNWSNLLYADSSAPTSFSSSTFTLTSATTVVKVIKAAQKYRYVRVVYSSNTNITNTVDIYPLGD